MEKLLTVGMATYDDYDGVFFTLQSLRLFHLFELENTGQVEYIVIDNNPSSSHGKEVKKLIENWIKGKYIPYTAKKSTSARNEIFKHATGKYTLCLDSHVLIDKDGVKSLLNYYEKNPDTKDLISGPLIYDDFKSYSTHFQPGWRDIMYGMWETDKENYEKGQPFEIPMMGLGLFSCRTAHWQGFNELFKGFGGEEGYIHEKFRRAGGKCVCIPQLRWNHRFNRPAGIPYPNILEERIWNYFIGWLEILQDPNHAFIEETVKAFSERLPEKMVRLILSNARETLKI